MLIFVPIVLIVLAAIFFLASRKPDIFRVERATRIRAAPERLFAAINDFHRWPDWSPWEKLDPAMQRTFEGSAAGLGAVYAWSGNSKAGAGRMQITRSNPSSRIAIQLDFLKPFPSQNLVEFLLRPDGNITEVRWAMSGQLPFVMKIMHVFVNMDAKIGKDFETGLAALKALAENA